MTTETDDLIARLEQYNTPDRTIDEQRHIAAIIHAAAERLREQEAEIARLTVSESEARAKIAVQLIVIARLDATITALYAELAKLKDAP